MSPIKGKFLADHKKWKCPQFCLKIRKSQLLNFRKSYFTFLRQKKCKISQENYFIMSDFNNNILKTDPDYNVSECYNNLCSYFVVPLILQPTHIYSLVV